MYSIDEAKDLISQLIDEALAGEEVTITRHGKPVVELRAKAPPRLGRLSKELIDELARHTSQFPRLDENAADLVRAMRDEEP